MSGWLNLNESLNTLKGQISNFANNVLAENEEGSESPTANYEELKSLYVQRESEIQNLKKVNEELQKCLRIPGSKNGEENDNNWDWTTPELMVRESISKENVSDLNMVIKELENEKKDLINQLEQLDAENQQNLAELVSKREHLQEENSNLKDECERLKHQNKIIASKEEKLKREFKELQKKVQESQNSSQPLINLNEKYNSIVKANQELNLKLEETTQELNVLKSTPESLEKIIYDTKKNGEQQLIELMEKLKKAEIENKSIYTELQKAKEHVNVSEQKIKEDSENCQKLSVILETYERQVGSLKEELDNIKNKKLNDKNVEVLEKSNQELQVNLDEALKRVDFLEKNETNVEEIMSNLKLETAYIRKEFEEKTKTEATLKQENESFVRTVQETHNKLKEIEHLNIKIKEMSLEKENLHKIYVNIITDNVKRYIDSSLVSNDNYESSEDPRILEFRRQVEDIFKILLDYKQKSEIFEKEVLRVSQEKTQLLNEKNSEIEKLIQNSEILSQDIIHKTETIKELETEITNLMISNDVLMSELDSYKISGLQTISESNEDNMLLLETDLDNANKRIGELEKIINNGSQIILSNESSNASLEAKVSDKLEDYQELLGSFDELKIDYDTVRNELSEKSNILGQVESKNEDLKSQLERIRADFENTDYQLSEANFSIDGLTEELEMTKLIQEGLIKENKELKLQNMSSIDIKSELNEIKEKWLTEENMRRELESQLKGIKEKFQNSKMMETTLKVQYDTLNKEHLTTVEAKNNLDHSLSSAKNSIAEYEKNYTELLQNYDNILLRCEELNTKLHQKDTDILKLHNNIKNIEDQKQELDKLLQEKTMQCQQLIQLEETRNEDLSSITKLHVQLQYQEKEIKSLTSRVKDEEIKKIELEQLSEKQTRDSKEMAEQKLADKEVLNTFKKQLQLTEEEIVNLGSALKESQEHQNLGNLDTNVKDFAQQTLETETDTSMVEQTLLAKNKETELLLREKEQLQQAVTNIQIELQHNQENIAVLQQQLQELSASRNELINMVTIKHQESLNYHNEIQRLSQIIKAENEKYIQLQAQLIQASNASQEIAKKSEENDRLIDENSFLKEKCEVLAKNLLEEQAKLQKIITEKSGPSEKELSLSKQLERLQSHLVELEEHYTQELLQAEQKNAELQTKVTGLEQREKNSSNMYTSVSIRANQQVETLQNQLQLVTNQREELRKKISDAEDTNSKQAAALTNLQFVLEQFQKDKEKDIIKETERIRRQINVEKQSQDTLRKEIDNLREQLEESKIGLQAASRLSDQLEIIKKQNSGLKEEVSQLQQKLAKNEETIHSLTSQTDGKIDKTLVKSLVVGLLSSGNIHNWNKDQAQIIKIIGTVLDFNQQDHDKVKLNQPQHGSWLGSILFPQPSTQNISQESLSQAFVRFLENESTPRVVPSLLSEQASRPSASTDSSKRTTPRASPIVLNEIVLPTFADFGQNRNSSSILKDVLKDNNNS